jgi:hypothetical protein
VAVAEAARTEGLQVGAVRTEGLQFGAAPFTGVERSFEEEPL